jgi:hypothetical protein
MGLHDKILQNTEIRTQVRFTVVLVLDAREIAMNTL